MLLIIKRTPDFQSIPFSIFQRESSDFPPSAVSQQNFTLAKALRELSFEDETEREMQRLYETAIKELPFRFHLSIYQNDRRSATRRYFYVFAKQSAKI